MVLTIAMTTLVGCNRDNGNPGGGGNVATTPNTFCLNQPPGTPGCQGFQNVGWNGWNGFQPYPVGANGWMGAPNFMGCNQFTGTWAPIYGGNMGLGCVNMGLLPHPFNTAAGWGNINWWTPPAALATGFGGWGGGIWGGGGFGVGAGGAWGGFMRWCQVIAPGTCGVGQCVPFNAGNPMGFCVGGGVW